jgi:outer membrane lipopolysaccharide assembly protein LptE/RlpB
LLLAGCIYHFTGGGLPSNVRTVYVDLWDNDTPYASVSADVQRTLQTELPRQLGVRLASRTAADAIVRGRITSYEEVSANVRPTDNDGRIDVLQAEVQISYQAEIYDVKGDRPLWKAGSISSVGTYNPNRESVDVGRGKAIRDIVSKITQGAQSQW